MLQPYAPRLQPYVMQASTSLRASTTKTWGRLLTCCSRAISRTRRRSSSRSGLPLPLPLNQGDPSPPQPNPPPHITTIQGEEGHHFFILESGECVATIQDGTCSQEVKRYEPGELFGEKSLLESAKRAATITAVGKVLVWTLSRSAFELKLGMSHGRMWQM